MKLLRTAKTPSVIIYLRVYEKWWHDVGSGMRPTENEDNEDFVKRVAETAFLFGNLTGKGKCHGE